jgi:hypothetical protein
MYLFDGGPDNYRGKALPLVVALLLVSIAASSGCAIRNRAELREALALARQLRSMVPEARELQRQEFMCIDELRITLDEAGRGEFSKFRDKFTLSIDTLSAIRDKRHTLQEKVREGSWETPLVRVVQMDALSMFQEEITRNEGWMALARNVRTRADLGRERDFPEVAVLRRQLELFTGEGDDDPPLFSQILMLRTEYGFSPGDISH